MFVSSMNRLLQGAEPVFLFSKCLALFTIWLGAAGTVAAQSAALQTIELYAGMHRLTAELAVEPDQRAQGLMGRQSLAEQRGMLFVFDRPGVQCFWMRNTFVPLSIAFLRDDGSIVNIEDMEPLKSDNHCSQEPVRLALEVNQGWFAARNVAPDMVIRGLPTLR